MDKQEIIEFIDDSICGTYEKLRSSDIDNAEEQIALNNSLMELKLIKKYLYQLDEPERPEKEELPDYIVKELNGELFKGEDEDFILYYFHRESFDRIHGEKYFLSDEVLDWFVIKGNTTRLINAIRNGYESYKEPVWVVKGHHGYLIELKVNKDHTGWVQETTGDPEDKYIIKFNNKEDAERAKVVVKDGKVEEWSE